MKLLNKILIGLVLGGSLATAAVSGTELLANPEGSRFEYANIIEARADEATGGNYERIDLKFETLIYSFTNSGNFDVVSIDNDTVLGFVSDTLDLSKLRKNPEFDRLYKKHIKSN